LFFYRNVVTEMSPDRNGQTEKSCSVQVLRELTLPLLADNEITCTGMYIKIYGQAVRKGPQNIAIAKGRCGITWI